MKHQLTRLFVLTLLLISLPACDPKEIDYSQIPVGSTFKADLQDGSTIYFMARDVQGKTLNGDYFIHRNEAVIDLKSFAADSVGNMTFADPDRRLSEGKLQLKKKGIFLSLSIDGRKEQVALMAIDSPTEITADEARPLRYQEKVFDGIYSQKNRQYARNAGYYTSYHLSGTAEQGMKNLGGDFIEVMGRCKDKREQALLMDIYEPEGDSLRNRPVLLYIHGGAFYFGDKENSLQEAFVDYFVEKGYVVASMNYRLGTSISEGTKAIEKAIYSGVQDQRAALRYLINNRKQLGIDPNQIYLVGNSAGGIISLTTTFMNNDELFLSIHKDWENFGPLDPSNDKLDPDFRIAGLVSLWGAVVDTKIIDTDTPIPTLLFHGTADDLVNPDRGLPYKNFFRENLKSKLGKTLNLFVNNVLFSGWTIHGSNTIYKHMRNKQMPVEYVPLVGYGHEPQENADGSMNGNMEIIREKMNDFIGQRVVNHYFPQELKGNTLINSNYHETSTYTLSRAEDVDVEWQAEGGIIVDRSNHSIRVVWINGAPTHKIRVYLSNNEGTTVNKELAVSVFQ